MEEEPVGVDVKGDGGSVLLREEEKKSLIIGGEGAKISLIIKAS